MRNIGPIVATAIGAVFAAAAHAKLPDIMHCRLNGHAGCVNGICVGTGTKDSSIKLSISHPDHRLLLNGITGTIDQGWGDPYADGDHKVRWNRNLLTYQSYRLFEPQPGRVFLTLSSDGSELDFKCLGG